MKRRLFVLLICGFVFAGCETLGGASDGAKKDVDNTYDNVKTGVDNVKEGAKKGVHAGWKAVDSVDSWFRENLW